MFKEMKGGIANHFFPIYRYSPDPIVQVAGQDDL
jgi:hypothetical protein